MTVKQSRRSFLGKISRGAIGVFTSGASAAGGAIAGGEIEKASGEQPILTSENTLHDRAMALVEREAKNRTLLPKEPLNKETFK